MKRWVATGIVVFGTVAAWWLFAAERAEVQGEPPPPPAGWKELADCSFLNSLDDQRQLVLTEEQSAHMADLSSRHQVDGTWEYDAASRRYAIRLGDERTSYALIVRGDPRTCILYKGDLHTADLAGSWFSFPMTDEDP